MKSLYHSIDAAALFLWTWFGIRRRWIILLGFALTCPKAFQDDLLMLIATLGILGYFTLTDYVFEASQAPLICNTVTLELRRHPLAVLSVFLVFFVAVWSFAGLFFDAPTSIAGRLSDLGFELWICARLSLIPTTPRKKIKLPAIFNPSPAAEAA